MEIFDDNEIEAFEDENFFVELFSDPANERISVLSLQSIARIFIEDNEGWWNDDKSLAWWIFVHF